MSNPENVLDTRLRLGAGFAPGDRDWVLGSLAPLAKHLAGWNPDQIDLQVTVKDRDSRTQHLTLELWLAGQQPFVATSDEEDLHHALIEARKELIRQVEDAKTRREPKKHRTAHNRTT
ncbi:MAG TPA: HPF/RaiA family ribosome-associated protein [Pseudonocardiaceae bacterium]|jgi:ribosome-associated translation inhibitor RaiA|nr:HPF/RaiA family ribosome-associated protein [Pseudonocardiaceae bacterium]